MLNRGVGEHMLARLAPSLLAWADRLLNRELIMCGLVYHMIILINLCLHESYLLYITVIWL